MARSRRKRGLEDSFDLFLDTITNTFGGVLMIAILLVLLLPKTKQMKEAKLKAEGFEGKHFLETEISNLKTQLQLIESQLTSQQQFVNDFGDEEAQELLLQLAASLDQNRKLNQQVKTLSSQTSKMVASINAIPEQDADVAAEIKRKKDELARLSKLKKPVKEEVETRTMDLPKEASTRKAEIQTMLEDNEMFFYRKPSRVRNTDHFANSGVFDADILDGTPYKTRPGNGVALDQLQNYMQRYDNKRYYFAIVVRSDSYQEFFKVRDACVAAGFEYRILPLDGAIAMGSNRSPKTQ